MPNSTRKRIVILGAGFAGTYVFKHLHKYFHRDPRVELVLVNPRNYFLFTPLLHEVATGSISPDNVVEPLRKVLGCCLGDFWRAEAQRVVTRDRVIETSEGPIAYDYLVLALGAQTDFAGTPGAAEHTFTLKSLEDAKRLKNHFIHLFERASKITEVEKRKALLRFVVVGGGPTGVELAAEMQEFFCESFKKLYQGTGLASEVEILLLQKSGELLPHFSPALRERSLKVLQKKGIKVFLHAAARRVGEYFIELQDGKRIESESVIWVAGIKPREIPFDEHVRRDARGRLEVLPTLQLPGYPEIFALGDLASIKHEKTGESLPALAQVATKEAKTVAENIRNLIVGKPLRQFRYRHSGDLVSLGQWMAVAEIAGVPFWGHITWWLWRTVYLSKLISWPKKVKVAMDWTINLFMPRDISEL